MNQRPLSNVRLALKVAIALGSLFAGMLVLDEALHLLSVPSNAAVGLGVGILIALAAVLAVVARTAWRRFRSRGPTVAALFVVLAQAGCWKVVEPGHVGICVNQSGSDRGVQDFPMQTGRVFYNPFTETVFQYPTFVQRAIWTSSKNEGSPNNEEISYNSKDELVFAGDFAVSYQLVRDEVPHFYVKFRNDDISGFTHGFFRDQVRDSLNEVAVRYTADELYGAKKSEFLNTAVELLRSRVKALGVDVVSLGYASSPRPPKQVADAINSKIAAIQLASQKENELNQAKADANKVAAIADGEARKKIALAEGEAKANELVTKSINSQIIQWRQLELQQDAIRKWNGGLPQYMGGGGPLPFLTVK